MRSAACITLLVMSLLFAQMLGFVHGIAHAGWQPGAVHSLLDESLFDYGDSHDDDDATPAAVQSAASANSSVSADAGSAVHAHGAHDLHHSCAAYDAATLSAAMHLDFPHPPLLPPAHMLALWQAFASWDAPVNCPFSSRAPPR